MNPTSQRTNANDNGHLHRPRRPWAPSPCRPGCHFPGPKPLQDCRPYRAVFTGLGVLPAGRRVNSPLVRKAREQDPMHQNGQAGESPFRLSGVTLPQTSPYDLKQNHVNIVPKKDYYTKKGAGFTVIPLPFYYGSNVE